MWCSVRVWSCVRMCFVCLPRSLFFSVHVYFGPLPLSLLLFLLFSSRRNGWPLSLPHSASALLQLWVMPCFATFNNRALVISLHRTLSGHVASLPMRSLEIYSKSIDKSVIAYLNAPLRPLYYPSCNKLKKDQISTLHNTTHINESFIYFNRISV